MIAAVISTITGIVGVALGLMAAFVAYVAFSSWLKRNVGEKGEASALISMIVAGLGAVCILGLTGHFTR